MVLQRLIALQDAALRVQIALSKCFGAIIILSLKNVFFFQNTFAMQLQAATFLQKTSLTRYCKHNFIPF